MTTPKKSEKQPGNTTDLLRGLRDGPAFAAAARRNEQREIVREAVEQADYETWKEFSMRKD